MTITVNLVALTIETQNKNGQHQKSLSVSVYLCLSLSRSLFVYLFLCLFKPLVQHLSLFIFSLSFSWRNGRFVEKCNLTNVLVSPNVKMFPFVITVSNSENIFCNYESKKSKVIVNFDKCHQF